MDKIKKTSNYLRTNRVLSHITFWLAFACFDYFNAIVSFSDDPLLGIAFMILCTMIPKILASYYFGYFVIPKFVLKQSYIQTVFLVIMGLYFFSALYRILVVHVGEPFIIIGPFEQEPLLEILTDIQKLLIKYVPSLFSAIFIFLFVKYFLNYNRIKEQDLMLKKEKTEAELKALMGQLNPHFLFNTLNNIYALSLEKSPQTPESIAKLSEILDHILYKCNDKTISLSEEVVLIKNYIELEKLRYDDRLKITLNMNLMEDARVPPLILLSLVENAFKHGAGEDSESPEIDISISSSSNVFKFMISNTISPNYKPDNKDAIGLENIKKQLNLIYKDQYELVIEALPLKFTVRLKINQNVIV